MYLCLLYICLCIEFYIIIQTYHISQFAINFVIKQIKLPAGHRGLYSERNILLSISTRFYLFNFILCYTLIVYIYIYIYIYICYSKIYY